MTWGRIVLIFIVFFVLAKQAVAQPTRIQVEMDDLPITSQDVSSENGAALWEIPYLPKNTIIELPEDFVVRDEWGHLDLTLTLENWQEASQNHPQYSRASHLYDSEYFPVQVARSPESILDGQIVWMPLNILVTTGAFLEVSYAEDFNFQNQTPFARPGRRKPNGFIINTLENLLGPSPYTKGRNDHLRCEYDISQSEDVFIAPQGMTHLSCKDVSLEMDEIDDNHFRSIPQGRERSRAFIQYFAPVAQYIQIETGFPASVMIAQIAQETGWGSSLQFRFYKNLTGKSCFNLNDSIDADFFMGSTRVSFEATCSNSRPPEEGGFYYRYRTRKESIVAYIHNLLFAENEHYPRIREEIAHINNTTDSPYLVANRETIINGLTNYATDPKYKSKLRSIINTNELYKLDLSENNPCQLCLSLQHSHSSTIIQAQNSEEEVL